MGIERATEMPGEGTRANHKDTAAAAVVTSSTGHPTV